MRQQKEYQLQVAIADYLRITYPDVMFLSDTVAAVKLTMPQAVRNKRIQCVGFHCPDLLILEPRHGYHGLFFELKSESPFKRDGTLKKDAHLEAQGVTLERLREKGYWAEFEWDFDNIRRRIDGYFAPIVQTQMNWYSRKGDEAQQ